ncbi:MAG TPA: hypothetical protein DCL61_02805 [Cyanobacteria bacterium UBA12227]|nr:hypothetical protein [Cyanobacteria bacterium UBA12227]HAX89334.1 hypothetical protein [Cyanobacteria bacterium UBA11370]HBY77001.1 hypothetical protein [Cyanobacteria bacterium UBA11148]
MDERLRQLIEATCQQPDGSLKRRRAMHRLLIELQRLPGLFKSSHPDYLQALNQTLEWIGRYICRDFEHRSQSLQQSLVNWINGYLYWRIRDIHSLDASNPISLDTLIGDSEYGTPLVDQLSETGLNTPTLSGLDGHIERLQQQKIQRLGLKMERYIQQDPEKKLQNCYPRTYPNCNCQLLSQKRYLKDPPDTFQEITQQLNMPLRQLTNHWYGRCKPLLQEIAKDLGYRPHEEP